MISIPNRNGITHFAKPADVAGLIRAADHMRDMLRLIEEKMAGTRAEPVAKDAADSYDYWHGKVYK